MVAQRKEPPTKRVALYLWAGHDPTPELGSQSARLHECAASKGWTTVAEFAEGAESGNTQFQAMMAAASKREFDVVLVWSLDRFGDAGIYKTFQYLNTLAGYDVDFRSFCEPFIDTTSASGDLLRSIFACFAALERQQRSERVRAGHDRVRAQGKQVGRPRVTPNTKLLAKIRGLYDEDHSKRHITKMLDIDREKVQRLLSDTEVAKKTRSVLSSAIAVAKQSEDGSCCAPVAGDNRGGRRNSPLLGVRGDA
jgi:putative DNA-invertase from lambdoid prophage Rac